LKFPRFDPLLQTGAHSDLNVTSYRCRLQVGVAGPNWLITGEAASMVDPITANGVTAALRHAAEASRLILKYRKRGKLPLRARMCYSSRIGQMTKFFNSGIEKIVYQPPVRNRLEMGRSGTIYTSPAWSMNVVYARLRPRGIISTLLLGSFLGFFRASAWVLYRVCKRLTPPKCQADLPWLRIAFCCERSAAMHLLSRGSGYPVLFIHGIPTSGQLWTGVIDKLLGRFTCLAVDLPGLGRLRRWVTALNSWKRWLTGSSKSG